MSQPLDTMDWGRLHKGGLDVFLFQVVNSSLGDLLPSQIDLPESGDAFQRSLA